MLYKLMKYVLLGPLLRLFFPCKVIGAEYIPRSGVEAGLGWMKAFALEERDYSPPSELRAGDNSR